MDNLKQLKILSEVFNTDNIITTDDIENVLTAIISILSNFKKDTDKLNEDTRLLISSILERINDEHQKLLNDVDSKNEGVIKALDEKIKSLDVIIEEIRSYKPENGKDGIDADEEKIVEEVLSKIKLPEYKETVLDDGEQIVEKINALSIEPELQIDAKHIKNLPTVSGGHSPTVIGNAVDLDQSARADGYAVVWDNTNKRFKFAASAGGGTPGGSNTQLQYNNAGSFGGISGATTNGTAVTFTTGNLIGTDIKAAGSAGLSVHNNSGQDVALFGAGGGINSTFYGSAKMDFLTASKVVFTDASKNLTSTGIGTSSDFIKGDGSLDSST